MTRIIKTISIMIHIFTEPSDWKDLQNKVCTLLSQSGFNAETEKKVQTPRGEVELDVFAIDPNSIDQISYIIECKNWSSPVNQAVVHRSEERRVGKECRI